MGHPSDHREHTAKDSYWKPLFFEFGHVVLPEKGRYMFQTFRKVAHNIREYAQTEWDDSNKNSWGTLVTTVSVVPKISTENHYFLSLGK